MKIHTFNETKYKLDSTLLKKIKLSIEQHFPKTKKHSYNLILISKSKIRSLKKRLFNKTESTDVIAVNNPERKSLNKGDVYICPEVILANAKKFDTAYNEEFARLVIHGILHLLGFDHKKPFGKSKERIFRIQETLLNKVNE